MTKTASTHLLEPLATEGKLYYVIDDAYEVFAAGVDWDTAHRKKEQVAGNLWSKTPSIHEMPADPAKGAKIVAAAGRSHRGKTNGTSKTPPAVAATVSPDVAAPAPEPVVAAPESPMPAEPVEPDPLAAELEQAVVEDIVGGDDDDLSGLDDL